MTIERIFVAGAGLMGAGIAQTCAQHGLAVDLYDIEEAALGRAERQLGSSLDRLVERGRLAAPEREAARARINLGAELERAEAADLVIEAVVESAEVKQRFFATVDGLCPPPVLFASNTSSIPITRLAAATRRPERFIGMHFYSPVPVMTLVEIVQGVRTTAATVQVIEELARRLGKTPVMARDLPGFIGNRILVPYLNEAMTALMQGAGTASSIDTVARLGFRHPMGPLELADFIGLDVVYSICQVLYEGFRDPRYAPCPLLERLVEAGHLGRKTGRGFHTYAADGSIASATD
ncbi:MAG TPA: 3-hydroxyacyl-CoA dehydrogenase NAD-binding domain-containing protein [Candidatus Micrarchaeia archaeon]|nr:3-hydroxyacyl-CoA dehydrogenase NAD-binding domain-containing protein [Candidatus Micrarchaeia archaeon]